MKTLSCLACLMLGVALVGAIPSAHAQSRPSIVYFDSTLAGISLAEAEQGLTTTTFSWVVMGMEADHALALEVYSGGQWQPATHPDGVLPPRGSVELTITHSQSFAPPTYRLRVVDGSGAVWDAWVLTIPYLWPEAALPPNVTFNAAGGLGADGSLSTTWAITERLPTHAVRFTQFLSSGNAVELDPLALGVHWVPSSATLALPLTPDPNAAQVLLRLEVLDVLSETVVASADLNVPTAFSNNAGEPSRGGGSGGFIAGNEPPAFVSATLSQNTAHYGDTLTIRWQNRGTAVRFSCTVQLGAGEPFPLVDSQEAAGSYAYTLPTGDYTQATFTLTMTDAQGLSRLRTEVVTMIK